MDQDHLAHALAMLRANKRWQQGGVDYRQGEYLWGGEEVWFEADAFVYRSWSAHGWGSGPPDDVHENIERWDEAKLRARLGDALGTYAWDSAPRGAPSVSSEFDPLRPMPGQMTCPLSVTDGDLDRVIRHLRGGYTFDQAGTEPRETRLVWGREQIRHPPPAQSEHFYRTRSWASGNGDDVCVRIETFDEPALRQLLGARPDIVHWERWPKS